LKKHKSLKKELQPDDEADKPKLEDANAEIFERE